MSHGQKQVFAIFQMQEERAWLAEPITHSSLAGIMARDPAAAASPARARSAGRRRSAQKTATA